MLGTGDVLILYVIWFALAFGLAGYLLKKSS